MENREPILEVTRLSKHFKLEKRAVYKAVDQVSFQIFKGETFGLVGQSGSGKSTTGRMMIRLYDATDGEVSFNGKVISGKLSKEERRHLNKKMQMIFQDPYASLDPRMTVMDIIAEGIDYHGLAANPSKRAEKVYALLETVGLNREHANRYPHEFSGGQRQRIGIARALAVEPEFMILDEPISALDVSIQAQVINLLKKMQRELNLTYLFIAHDLAMVKYISSRVGVMHKGRLVELAETKELYANPLHPYTKSLLSAIPVPDPLKERARKRITYDPSIHKYDVEQPVWAEVTPGHWVLCSERELAQYRSDLALVASQTSKKGEQSGKSKEQ
ncbi:ABC transporter ATP-binding protein [Brevibacillus sp. NRS-1366]|uniref:ABC transporter ATP-binding protein n=1 Tax=Brevibacillus sp. NRS-1366 TaxID=3233899 RepID=UPI003D1A7803